MPPRSGEWRLRCGDECPWYRWSVNHATGKCLIRKDAGGDPLLLWDDGESSPPCHASDAQLRKALAAYAEPVERELARRKGGGK
jgi:hypothetical protein